MSKFWKQVIVVSILILKILGNIPVKNREISLILKTSQNDEEVEIVQMTEYIESEQMYLTNFDFNLIEKGGN